MRVSVFGLGIIGSAWAENLVADGIDVRCWNRTPKPLPGFYALAEDAVEGSQFVIIVVSDPAAVQSVIDQIIPKLMRGQVVIQCSTISAKWSRLFAQQIAQTGAEYLEAPFTGSKPAALERKTVFYVGGETSILESTRPLLERLSSSILHVGPVGSAASLKLAMNINVAGVAQILCESISFARAEGISDETYFSALKLNASRSGISELKEPKLRKSDFTPQFSIKHMAKDLGLALETGSEDGIRLNCTNHLLTLYKNALSAGWGDDDFISLVRLINETDSAG